MRLFSGKLLFHLTFNQNFRIFWRNSKHLLQFPEKKTSAQCKMFQLFNAKEQKSRVKPRPGIMFCFTLVLNSDWTVRIKKQVTRKSWRSRGHFVSGGGGRENFQKNWMGCAARFNKTIILFMTKICDFHTWPKIRYPFYDLTHTLFQTCLIIICLVHTDIKRVVKGFCWWSYW